MLFSVTVVSTKGFSLNAGDIGSSVLGTHQAVACGYSIPSSTSGGIWGSYGPTGGSGGIGGTTTYSGIVPGHADYCGGYWGFCSANGYCQPNFGSN